MNQFPKVEGCISGGTDTNVARGGSHQSIAEGSQVNRSGSVVVVDQEVQLTLSKSSLRRQVKGQFGVQVPPTIAWARSKSRCFRRSSPLSVSVSVIRGPIKPGGEPNKYRHI